jgi:hypothetical protein
VASFTFHHSATVAIHRRSINYIFLVDEDYTPLLRLISYREHVIASPDRASYDGAELLYVLKEAR